MEQFENSKDRAVIQTGRENAPLVDEMAANALDQLD